MKMNYHLTTTSGLRRTGITDLPPGFYPAQRDPLTSDCWVAPADYVEEWERRMVGKYMPGTDDSCEQAVRAWHANMPLPPEPPADTIAWGPNHPDWPQASLTSTHIRRRLSNVVS